MPDTPLDDDLVAAILKNLTIEPSEHLRTMLAEPDGGHWSPEALQAARLLLDQRANGTAAEPRTRTAPYVVRAEQQQSTRGPRPGDLVLAPDFAVPRGFSWLLFLGRFFGGGTLRPAQLAEIGGREAFLYFHNGKRGWVRLADVRPLSLDVGTRLYIDTHGGWGVITGWRDEDDRFKIRYDDGMEEWISLDELVC